MRINFLIIGLLICVIMVIISGCTTSCIPVTPSQAISTDSGRCIAVINNTGYEVTYSSDCLKIVPNQINRVFFRGYGMPNVRAAQSSFIDGVCQP